MRQMQDNFACRINTVGEFKINCHLVGDE